MWHIYAGLLQVLCIRGKNPIQIFKASAFAANCEEFSYFFISTMTVRWTATEATSPSLNCDADKKTEDDGNVTFFQAWAAATTAAMMGSPLKALALGLLPLPFEGPVSWR